MSASNAPAARAREDRGTFVDVRSTDGIFFFEKERVRIFF